MKEWKESSIKEIAIRITSGGTPSTKKLEYYEGGNIAWLNTKEVNFNRIYATEKHITEEGLKNSSAKYIEANSVIVAMYGATAAKVAINKIPLTTNQACCNITVNDEVCDYEFLYYNISNKYSELENIAVGAAQQNLSVGVIGEFILKLPPLPEQKAIASVLSSLDDKIDLLHQQNQTLEALAETLFRQWFIERRPEHVEGETKEDWEEIELGSVIETTSGGTPSRTKMEYYENGTIPWVKSKELNGGFILETEEKITEEALKNSSAKILPSNSILIAMYGATVGEYAIISKKMTCNQAICALKPNDNYPYAYLFLLIKNLKQDLINMAVGSAQQNISQLLIKQLPVLTCTDVIKKFHDEVNPLFKKQFENSKQIQTLTKLRDTLLPKLMSGEVRVKM